MAFSVQLLFDAEAEAAVRMVWRWLAGAGIPPAIDKPGSRPHVSLAVCEERPRDGIEIALAAFALARPPFPLSLAGVGTFPGDEAVVYLDVARSPALLEAHAALRRLVEPYLAQPRHYYDPDVWHPHCTLAYRLAGDEMGRAVALCERALPRLAAEAREVGLVEGTLTSSRMLWSRRLGDEEG